MGESNTIEKTPTVLVVDDDVETADLYTEFLSEQYEVRTAYSGETALKLVDSTVDVVLLDRRMPDVTGDEVLTAIRARDLDCRVVMVTAVDPDVDILELEFDDYLVKPATRDRIRDAVARMLVRNGCDAEIQRIVALASKMATIESKMTLTELHGSEVYAALEAQFTDLRGNADLGDPEDDAYVEFTDEKIRSLFG